MQKPSQKNMLNLVEIAKQLQKKRNKFKKDDAM